VLAFSRRPGFVGVVNLGDTPVAVPPSLLGGASVILASHPLDPDARVPTDTAVWYAHR
jgi:alpha-glucosidase